MPRLRRRPPVRPQVPIAPMIDCVFLLLIYFMVSASLQRQEADISFELPGTVAQADPVEMPDEQIIEVRADGQAIVNEYAYDRPADSRYTELTAMLTRFREAAEASRTEASVTIAPDDSTAHEFIVKVMDACAAAGIEATRFSFSEPE